MSENALSTFHFTNITWLWGLLLLPVIWVLYLALYKKGGLEPQLRKFADAHLLPHLLLDEAVSANKKRKFLKALILWSVIWTGGILAMAGPRWGYTQVQAFRPAGSLVILLDTSRSMLAEDVSPSRFERAKQEIIDLSGELQGTNIGLIVYAAIPHVITPLSDDTQTMRGFLPSLNPNLIHTQGGNLPIALTRAGEMFETLKGDEKHILIISDGEFERDAQHIASVIDALDKEGIKTHGLGIGTREGAPIPDGKKGYIKENTKMVLSRLDEKAFKSLIGEGGGRYIRANYLNSDTSILSQQVKNEAAQENTQDAKTTKFWEERFYLFLLLPILCMLPLFRRGAAFPALVVMSVLMSAQPAAAFDWRDLFGGSDQRGKEAYEQGHYEDAAEDFTDPYNRGVAEYKAGKYEDAARSFADSNRESVKTDAAYNLGNAQLMNGQIDDAIQSYQELLKTNPDHKDAAHNLEIAKKLKQQQENQQNQQQQDNQDQSSDNDEKQEQGDNQQQGSNPDQQEQDGGQESDQEQQSSEDAQENENQNNQASDNQQEQENPQENDAQDQQSATQNQARSQEDINADQWLNRIENNQEEFLRNKFYIESIRAKAQEGQQPW